MNWKKLFILVAGLLIFTSKSFATITIDSIATTLSSCSNNGVAVVFATSNPPGPLLFAITSGPILAPIQNSNIFSSLFPGNYNLRVYDVNFDSTDYQFQITGNYQLPEFSLLGLDPTCPGFTDGSINTIVDSTKGLPPYTYEITAPIVVPPQATGFFPNLASNTYFVRVTDACGNYQTRTEILFNTGTALGINNFIVPSVLKIGCDTIKVSSSIYLYKEKWNQPINVTYNTSSGPITKQATLTVIDTINNTPGLFDVTDTIPGLTYGDYLNVVFTDVCGVSVSSGINTIAPYDFEVIFSPTTIACISTFSGSVQLKQYPNYPFDFTSPMIPLSFIMTDATTGVVVDSGGCGYQYCGISLIPQVPGNLYTLTITDGCGEVWQENIMWPSAGQPEVNIYSNYGCMDSTASLAIECLGFQSAPWITFLSGPANATSTKPYYAYNDTIIYPQTFSGAVIPNVIYVKDFPMGLYTFIVEDSCGNSVPGTFLVENYMVSNLNFTWFVKPSCLNNNTLFYNFQEGTGGAVYASITDLSTNQVVANPPLSYFLDSLTTIAVGNYALEIYYLNHLGNGQYFDGGLINSGNSCWVLHDTITIAPYINNYFITNSTVYCNGNYYVALEVDSSRGVPPYQFAIISGPQTFPLQDSAFFQITAFGNYTISMEDACGNNYTQQISVTSDSLPPIVKSGYFCEGNNASLTFGSSPYFTTIWTLPNGNSVTGDSLIFQPFTAADTGQYIASTIISINGCLDSLTSLFYLSGKDSVNQTFSICPGDSIYVGSSVYTLPGVYRDTVSTSLGCDSVLVTTIFLQPTLIDSTNISICNGDSLLVGNNYYSSTGIYLDTVYTGNCQKIIITDLTVDLILDSISVVLCQGDSFVVGNIVHQTAGIFTDTLTAVSGCDSLMVVSISITPIIVDSTAISICYGDSLLVGNNYYSSTGIYMDTVYTGNCQKIIITDLTVDLILDSISVVLCQGDSFVVGNIVHQNAGIFTDTLTAVSGCDSLMVVSISITPIIVDSTAISICYGDSILIGNNYYSSTGIYLDTVYTGNCQKIIITDLTVDLILDSISVVLCQGDSFVIGNIIHQTAGIFTDTLTAVSGCDSLVVASITITPIIVDSTAISICYGDSILVGINYYSSTGIYMDTVITGNCQKIIITDLTADLILDSISVVLCQGDSFVVGNIIHQTVGIFTDTLTAVSGCDSLVVVSISITPIIVDSTAISICYGDSILVGINYYSSTGIYLDTVYTGNCQKIIITDLTADLILDSISVVLCQGDSFVVGNIVHQTAGIFTDTLTAVSGCDSLVVVSISITPIVVDSTAISICYGDSILVGNNYYSSTGIYMDTVITGNCQKIIITDLTVDLILDSISVVLCQGDSFVVGNIVHQNAGIFTDTLTAVSGCDSLMVVSISITPIIVDSTAISICYGDSILIGNNYYSSTGIYLDTVYTGNCQKIIITDLTVDLILDSISVVLCQGDSFVVGNIIHQNAGIFTDTLTAAAGCDSLVVSTITILNGGSSSLNYVICSGDSFYFGSSFVNVSGVYFDTLSTVSCDSIIELQLTVLPAISSEIIADTSLLLSNGQVYLSSIYDPDYSYLWSGNAIFDTPLLNSTNALLDSSAWVYLSISNSFGCMVYDSIWFNLVYEQQPDTCESAGIYIPNAFTPNNDGFNDSFEIITNSLSDINYTIFNRWGQVVFESSKNEKKWNGYSKSRKCPSGVYVYFVKYESCLDKKIKVLKGNLTLID